MTIRSTVNRPESLCGFLATAATTVAIGGCIGTTIGLFFESAIEAKWQSASQDPEFSPLPIFATFGAMIYPLWKVILWKMQIESSLPNRVEEVARQVKQE